MSPDGSRIFLVVQSAWANYEAVSIYMPRSRQRFSWRKPKGPPRVFTHRFGETRHFATRPVDLFPENCKIEGPLDHQKGSPAAEAAEGARPSRVWAIMRVGGNHFVVGPAASS